MVVPALGFSLGGFKVVGDTSLKAFSVYVVDRNRPLYDWAK
jgi:hypothetical protein